MSALPVRDPAPLPEIKGAPFQPFPDASRTFRFLWRTGFALSQVLFHARIYNEHYLPRTGPVVVAPNHPTYFDPAMLFMLLPRRCHIMAWDALFSIPLASWFMRKGGAYPVKLRGGEREAITNTRNLLKAGRCVGIFPEGGRSDADGTMRPFRNGPATLAIRAGAAIVPVTINGAHRLWPRGTLLPRVSGPVRFIVHPPIVPPETGPRAAKGSLPDELTRRLRTAVASVYEGAVAPQ